MMRCETNETEPLLQCVEIHKKNADQVTNVNNPGRNTDENLCEKTSSYENFGKGGAIVCQKTEHYGESVFISTGDNSQVNCCEEREKPKGKLVFSELSRNTKYLLFCCVLAHFMAGLATSLLAPFYPQVAQTKGMSVVLIGVTFSLYPVIMFLTSPIFGFYMTRVGPKFLLISGLAVGGVCNCLYGTLNKSPPGLPFIITSLACRFVQGLGFSAYSNAVYTIAFNEFSEHAATSISILQTASEVGLMLGPGVGGFLYEAGGFGTPFYIIGIIVVVNALVLYKIVPEVIVNVGKVDENKEAKRSTQCNGLIIISCASVVVGTTGITFLEATLANHLTPLGLSTGVIGLLFSMVPCCFVITAPICGYLTDVKGLEAYFLTIGQLISGLGFYLIGPGLMFPFLPLSTWNVVLGLVLIGVGISGCVVPVSRCLILGAMEAGRENNTDTNAFISSMNNTTYSFGAFIGPLVGSALVQHQGYAVGYTVLGSWNVAVFGLCVVVFVSRFLSSKNSPK